MLAAEARENRRQELQKKIAEGQAAKKQKLERDARAGGSRAAEGSQTEPEPEPEPQKEIKTGGGQASGEPREAGGWGVGGKEALGSLARSHQA